MVKSKVKVTKTISSDLWCIYYYPCGKSINSFLVKKQFCKSLYIAYKVAQELMLPGNRVSSIECLDCIIDF